jgi:cell division protein FtsB
MQVQDRHLEQRSSSPVEEAIVAELTETIELQARKLESLTEEVENLRRERAQLVDELHMAHVWIRELAAELQRSDLPVPC